MSNALVVEQPAAEGGTRNPAPPVNLAAAAAGGVPPQICPITRSACAVQPACCFTEPVVHVGKLSSPAGLGNTPCALWVEAARAAGRAQLEPQVDARAADALPEGGAA